MGKLKHLLFGSCVLIAGVAFAQAPSHPNYIASDDSKTPFYTAYANWTEGHTLYSAGQAKDDEEFYISRVKPKERFTNAQTQVKPGLKSERKLLWWCPVGASGWNAIPTYFFNSEAFSMWSYVDIYGNWTAPMIRMPAAFADICHKNGVVTSTLASIPFGKNLAADDGGHGQNMRAMIDGGPDKLLKFLRHYGIDGIGYNSEFTIGSSIGATNLKNLFSGTFAKKDALKWPTFHNVWYTLVGNSGSMSFNDGLNNSNKDWFDWNGHPASNAYFSNYNWGASQLATSVQTAQSLGRSSFDVYGGMDFQGRGYADWGALANYDISVGIWGAHNMNMIFENRGERGAEPVTMQKTYQLCSENVFTGSSYNPVNTPPVKGTLAHTSYATDFHGFSSFITARSPLQSTNLANEPFVTYFNLGNGQFFNVKGERTFSNEWYNIGIQDYLPTWRWWFTSKFMGRSAADVPTKGLKAEFTWDDAWFGGSCLAIEGETDLEYLHLFKTKYALQAADELLIRYKVVSGTGNMTWTCSAEGAETAEVSPRSWTLDAKPDWQTKLIRVGNSSTSLKLANKTMAMMALKFMNTSSDFKILIGEVSLTRGTAATPVSPVITKTTLLDTNYKGIDFKVYYKMPNTVAAGEPVYNADVATWYYKIYIQQEGEKEVMCTATTSWAAYVVQAPRNVNGTNRIRMGVQAVSLDGNSESAITWSAYETLPKNTIVEGIEIDKVVIKAGEEFTVKFIDPTHNPANSWQFLQSNSGASVSAPTSGGVSITTTLPNVGLYDLAVNYSRVGKNDTTEIYRGFVQISGDEVGALPQIKELKANNSASAIEVQAGTNVTYSYLGRAADGVVSRALRLPEYAFSAAADQFNLTGQSPFSICFWFKPERFNHQSDGTQLLNIRTREDGWPASDWGYVWSEIGRDGSYGLSIRRTGNEGTRLDVKDFVFLPNQWTHIALVIGYQGGRQITIYANGKRIGQSAIFNDIYTWKNSNDIMIGGPAFGRAALDGYVDEVQIYKKALDLEGVRNSMKHQITIPDGLAGYWDFETEANKDNYLLSTGKETSLKAAVVVLKNEGEGKNSYIAQAPGYGPGAPFIAGTNYKIETLPNWKLGSDATITRAPSNTTTSGDVVASYAKGGTYEATLTLANGWGTDKKTFQYVKVIGESAGIDNDKAGAYSAYPNPFENEVNVEFVASGSYLVEVHNIAGQLVSTQTIIANAGEFVRIAIDGGAGTYFIAIKENDKVLKTLKVIKK
ncbi:MAG: LamG-like jellyroll fold domain-containing protein [Bacteroides sp.]